MDVAELRNMFQEDSGLNPTRYRDQVNRSLTHFLEQRGDQPKLIWVEGDYISGRQYYEPHEDGDYKSTYKFQRYKKTVYRPLLTYEEIYMAVAPEGLSDYSLSDQVIAAADEALHDHYHSLQTNSERVSVEGEIDYHHLEPSERPDNITEDKFPRYYKARHGDGHTGIGG